VFEENEDRKSAHSNRRGNSVYMLIMLGCIAESRVWYVGAEKVLNTCFSLKLADIGAHTNKRSI